MAEGRRQLVTAVDGRARAAGIAPGLPLADARAFCPDLVAASADPAGDAAALARLAAWCGRFSPWTAPNGPDGVWLDISGCAHLRGGEAALAAELVARLAHDGIAARAAVADTPGAAWAVARGGAPDGKAAVAVVPEGGARPALAGLPLQGLRLDAAAAGALERLGLRRIGDLYPLPRAALAARFGAILAQRLDQALGIVAEPLSPLPPAPLRWSRCRLPEPIETPEALAAVLEQLVPALCRQLGREGSGARRLVLTLYRSDNTVAEAVVGTARPSRDPRHLLRLLGERLESLAPEPGVEDMRLAAALVAPLAAQQLDLGPLAARGQAMPAPPSDRVVRLARAALPPAEACRVAAEDPELAALVDRLANRLGPAALWRPLPRASHLPERAVQAAPVCAPFIGKAWATETPRPLRLLPRPEPVEAVAPVPDDPPVLFRWRRLAHRVSRADGPERIAGEWWRDRAAREEDDIRDYYRVEDEAGDRFWLYRAGLYRADAPARWFLHGLFA
jgi:protein ImuB